MGTWGTGIYSSDTAEDIRTLCNEIFPFVSIEKGNEIIFEEFRETIDSDLVDDDFASFWYALADWQWKHGILSEEIRKKAVALLNDYAGLSDWKESGSAADIKRRTAVLDKLKEQLQSPMPQVRLPKAKLEKSKHKPGDVILFKACSQPEDEHNALWQIHCLRPPDIFKDPRISNSPDRLEPPFYAYGKYMAILCIGIEKEAYSPHLLGLYNEYSVYVFYDHLSDGKPDLEILQKCGFLPQISWRMKDPFQNSIDYIGWTYPFLIYGESFGRSLPFGVSEVERIRCDKEAKRYERLIEGKPYLNTVEKYSSLYSSFECFEEKVRMERLGIPVDTLVSGNAVNPELLMPVEKEFNEH